MTATDYDRDRAQTRLSMSGKAVAACSTAAATDVYAASRAQDQVLQYQHQTQGLSFCS
jgi:hypothetical protein